MKFVLFDVMLANGDLCPMAVNMELVTVIRPSDNPKLYTEIFFSVPNQSVIVTRDLGDILLMLSKFENRFIDDMSNKKND